MPESNQQSRREETSAFDAEAYRQLKVAHRELLEQIEALRAVADHHIAEAERSEKHAEERDQYAQQLEEQYQALENASRSVAYLNDDGLCWCDEWYHAQDPTTGEQRDVTEHQEACRRLRGLVSNPAKELDA